MGTQAENQSSQTAKSGGARRDRTADLLHAMQALSQLSYGPIRRRGTLPEAGQFVKKMNGVLFISSTPKSACTAYSRQGFLFAQNRKRHVDRRRYRATANSQANRLRKLAQRDAPGSRQRAHQFMNRWRR